MDIGGMFDTANTANNLGGSSYGQGSYGSGLIGGIGDMIIGPIMANQSKVMASKANRHAREFAMFMMRNGPRIQRKALEKAGYNPMLPFIGGSGVKFDAPHVQAARTPDIRSTGSFSGAMSNARQAGMFRDQQRLLRHEADTAGYGSSRALAEVEEKAAHAQSLKAEAGAASARDVRDQAEAVRIRALTDLVPVDRKRIEALTEQIGLETELRRKDLPRREVMEEIFEDLGEVTGAVRNLPLSLRNSLSKTKRDIELRTGERYDLKSPEGRARWRREHGE